MRAPVRTAGLSRAGSLRIKNLPASSELASLLSAGEDLQREVRLQVWSGQAADLATPTSQDAWSDQVMQALPDVVILKSQSLGGRQPARLLSCWERLLGQGYSHVYKATPHGDAVMLVKEPWMVEAHLSDMSTSRQTVTVK